MREWAEVPPYLTDCEIVPNVVHEIRASADEGAWLSDPLAIGTTQDADCLSQRWVDITGGPIPGMPGLRLPPERTTNLADVRYAIRTF